MKNKKFMFSKKSSRDIENHAKWQYNTFFLDSIIPALDFMIKEGHSYPNNLSYKEWRKVLQEMRNGFKLLKEIEEIDGWSFHRKLSKINKIKIDRSFNLFKEHFFDLWD